MALTKVEKLENPIAALEDRVSGQADTLKAYFDKNPQQLMEAINRLIDELEAQTAGDAIGVQARGLVSKKLNAALEELRAAIDALVGGLIPDQSVTTARIANGAVTEEKLDSAYREKLAQDLTANLTALTALLSEHKNAVSAHGTLFAGKVSVVEKAQDGNLAMLTSAGQLSDSGKAAGSVVFKPVKVIAYTNNAVTLEDNKEYLFSDVTQLAIAFPYGSFHAHMHLDVAAEGTADITFPKEAVWIGNKPQFQNGDKWEIDVKDGIVIAVIVGDGT